MQKLPRRNVLDFRITIKTPSTGLPATGLTDVMLSIADSAGGDPIAPSLNVPATEDTAIPGDYLATLLGADTNRDLASRDNRVVFRCVTSGTSLREIEKMLVEPGAGLLP